MPAIPAKRTFSRLLSPFCQILNLMKIISADRLGPHASFSAKTVASASAAPSEKTFEEVNHEYDHKYYDYDPDDRPDDYMEKV